MDKKNLPLRVENVLMLQTLLDVLARRLLYMEFNVTCPERGFGNRVSTIRAAITSMEWGETPDQWNIKGCLLRVVSGPLAAEGDFHAPKMPAEGYAFAGCVSTAQSGTWLKVEVAR